MIRWAGLELECPPDVFPPKASSIPLLRLAKGHQRTRSGTPWLIDLCSGSGALGIALWVQDPRRFNRLLALDASESAVRCSGRNIRQHGIPGRAQQWSAGDPIPGEVHDAFIICNPPYLPFAEGDSPSGRAEWIVSAEGGLRLPRLCLQSASSLNSILLMKGLESQLPALVQSKHRCELRAQYRQSGGVVVSIWHSGSKGAAAQHLLETPIDGCRRG